jgi:hypothetical protein
MDWDLVSTGEYIVYEAYQKTDPDTYPDVYNDRWLIEYTTQLIKRQWGANLSKFKDIQLPGGITYNGAEIWEQANTKIEELEKEVINSYSMPVMDMIG